MKRVKSLLVQIRKNLDERDLLKDLMHFNNERADVIAADCFADMNRYPAYQDQIESIKQQIYGLQAEEERLNQSLIQLFSELNHVLSSLEQPFGLSHTFLH